MDICIHIAREARAQNDPPEAKWYALWDLFLNVIAAADQGLLVFPQMVFRLTTANETNAINKSTRYPDFALFDVLAEYAPNDPDTIIRVTKKLLIVLEVKPKGVSVEVMQNELVDQIKHHYWMQDRDNDMQVIAISVRGEKWAWANVQRASGTSPAVESGHAAVIFIAERQHVAFTTVRPGETDPQHWTDYAALGGLQSNVQLVKVLAIIASRRL